MPEAYTSFLEVLGSRLEPLNTDAPAEVRDATTVPLPLLAHLAWSRGLDYWDSTWAEPIKRQLTNDTPANLRIRGTRAAIDTALATFTASLDIQEWFEQSPEGLPGTATATVLPGSALANDTEGQTTISKILEREGRLSTHWALLVGDIGSSAIAPAGAARVTVLTQYSGVQSGA
jgi:phage tail P2-like protein